MQTTKPKVMRWVSKTCYNVNTKEMSAEALFSTSTLENALRARVSMENFYENLLIQDRDRSNRWEKLERSMEDMALSNDEVCVCISTVVRTDLSLGYT